MPRKDTTRKALAAVKPEPSIEEQLREYFSISTLERGTSELDLRLSDFIVQLLAHSPARADLAVQIFKACGVAWDKARDEYGQTFTHPHERAILHSFHEIQVELVNTLNPLPSDQSIRRELEIYGAGADLPTRAAINNALKNGSKRDVLTLWAHVGVYGTIEQKKKKRA